MISIDNLDLYLSFKTALKSSPTRETLHSLHPDYQKLVFQNSSSKKLNNHELTILHLLCKTRNLDLFLSLFEKDPVFFQTLINHPNQIGWTPIYFSIKRNDLAFVEALISRKAFLKPAKFASPLILACQKGDRKLLDYILAEINEETLHYQDIDGITALFMAIYVQKLDFLQLLIEKYGLKTRVFDKAGASLLHWACSSENLVIFRYLIEKADLKDLINHHDHEGNTALHYLAQNCDKMEFYQEIINYGGDLNIKNKEGFIAEVVANESENVFGKEILESLSGNKEKKPDNVKNWCLLL